MLIRDRVIPTVSMDQLLFPFKATAQYFPFLSLHFNKENTLLSSNHNFLLYQKHSNEFDCLFNCRDIITRMKISFRINDHLKYNQQLKQKHKFDKNRVIKF